MARNSLEKAAMGQVRGAGVAILVGLVGCAAGVDQGMDGLGFGSAPGPGNAETGDDDDGDTDADDDDDGGFETTAGVSGSETGAPGPGPPPPGGSSGSVPPGGTTGALPPMTTGSPQVGTTSGFPEVGSTTSPFSDTGAFTTGAGGSGQVGDPCLQNADCETGLCVDDGFSIFCTQQCVTSDDCPLGWLCVETTTPGLSVCI